MKVWGKRSNATMGLIDGDYGSKGSPYSTVIRVRTVVQAPADITTYIATHFPELSNEGGDNITRLVERFTAIGQPWVASSSAGCWRSSQGYLPLLGLPHIYVQVTESALLILWPIEAQVQAGGGCDLKADAFISNMPADRAASFLSQHGKAFHLAAGDFLWVPACWHVCILSMSDQGVSHGVFQPILASGALQHAPATILTRVLRVVLKFAESTWTASKFFAAVVPNADAGMSELLLAWLREMIVFGEKRVAETPLPPVGALEASQLPRALQDAPRTSAGKVQTGASGEAGDACDETLAEASQIDCGETQKTTARGEDSQLPTAPDEHEIH